MRRSRGGAGRREEWEGVGGGGNVAGGAKGAAWCGVTAPKEIPFEDIMIPENGPTVPAWSLPARSRMDCFAAFCGADPLFATFERRIPPLSPCWLRMLLDFGV